MCKRRVEEEMRSSNKDKTFAPKSSVFTYKCVFCMYVCVCEPGTVVTFRNEHDRTSSPYWAYLHGKLW